jgi:hypothetical protein
MADEPRNRRKSGKSKDDSKSKSGRSKSSGKSSGKRSKSATEAPAPPRAPERKPKGGEHAKKAANIAKSFAKAVASTSARIGRISSDHISRLAKTAADATKAYKLSRAAAKAAKEEARAKRNSADTRKAKAAAKEAEKRAKEAEKQAADAKKEAAETVRLAAEATAKYVKEQQSATNAAKAQAAVMRAQVKGARGEKPSALVVVPLRRPDVESPQEKAKRIDAQIKQEKSAMNVSGNRIKSRSLGNKGRADFTKVFEAALQAQKDKASGTLVKARESVQKLRRESFERRKEQVGKGLDAAEEKKRRKSAAPTSAQAEEKITAGDLSGGTKALSEQQLGDEKLARTLTMMLKGQLDNEELVKSRIRLMVQKTGVVDASMIEEKVEIIHKMVKGSEQLKEHLMNYLFKGGPSLEDLNYKPEQIVIASQMVEDQVKEMRKVERVK